MAEPISRGSDFNQMSNNNTVTSSTDLLQHLKTPRKSCFTHSPSSNAPPGTLRLPDTFLHRRPEAQLHLNQGSGPQHCCTTPDAPTTKPQTTGPRFSAAVKPFSPPTSTTMTSPRRPLSQVTTFHRLSSSLTPTTEPSATPTYATPLLPTVPKRNDEIEQESRPCPPNSNLSVRPQRIASIASSPKLLILPPSLPMEKWVTHYSTTR